MIIKKKTKTTLQASGPGGKTKASSQAEGKNEAFLLVLVEVMGPDMPRGAWIQKPKSLGHMPKKSPPCWSPSNKYDQKRYYSAEAELHSRMPQPSRTGTAMGCTQTLTPGNISLLKWHLMDLLLQITFLTPTATRSPSPVSALTGAATRTSATNNSRSIVHRAISKVLWPKHLRSALRTCCSMHSYQAM